MFVHFVEMMWLDNSNHFVLSNPDVSVGSLAGPSQEDLCEPHVIKGSETTFEILYSPVIKYGLNLNKTTIDIKAVWRVTPREREPQVGISWSETSHNIH